MNLEIFITLCTMRDWLKNIKNKFYGINITSIKTLDEKLALTLNKYLLENGDINKYALLHKNMKNFQNLILHNLDEFILKEYPYINIGPDATYKDLEASYANITDDKIILDDTSYLKSELSNLILNHNKNLLIPSTKHLLEEKGKLVDWYSYNTPVMNDPAITPLRGTSLENKFFGVNNFFPTPKNLYVDWIMTSAYLLSEYNIWKKALYYASVENKNYDSRYIEFKQAYNFIILRQFKINQINRHSFDLKNIYIRDFTIKDVISRELYEDILYILLNLLLANKIIGNIALENSFNNENNFMDILKDTIKDHYEDVENKEGYSCLKDLRWYSVNNYLTEYHIKMISGKI